MDAQQIDPVARWEQTIAQPLATEYDDVDENAPREPIPSERLLPDNYEWQMSGVASALINLAESVFHGTMEVGVNSSACLLSGEEIVRLRRALELSGLALTQAHSIMSPHLAAIQEGRQAELSKERESRQHLSAGRRRLRRAWDRGWAINEDVDGTWTVQTARGPRAVPAEVASALRAWRDELRQRIGDEEFHE